MLNEIIEIADILLETSRQDNEDKSIQKGYAAFAADTVFKYGCDRLNCATALYKAGYRKKDEAGINEAESKQYETCKLYNPEKDECSALLHMYCKSERCKFYIDKEKRGAENGNVAFICDRQQCENCSFPECAHTTDIEHAANFENVGGRFIEKAE